MAPIVQTIDFAMGAALKYHRWVKHNEALWGQVNATYGFRLPNDPRGSKSKKVYAELLKSFGGARQEVANAAVAIACRTAAAESSGGSWPHDGFAMPPSAKAARAIKKSQYSTLSPSGASLLVARGSHSSGSV